jgi:hypothetical protein
MMVLAESGPVGNHAVISFQINEEFRIIKNFYEKLKKSLTYKHRLFTIAAVKAKPAVRRRRKATDLFKDEQIAGLPERNQHGRPAFFYGGPYLFPARSSACQKFFPLISSPPGRGRGFRVRGG